MPVVASERLAGTASGPLKSLLKARWMTPSAACAPARRVSTPLEAVAAGLRRASAEMTAFHRDLGPRLKAAVAARTELRERDTLKSVGLAVAMADALKARGVPDPRDDRR